MKNTLKISLLIAGMLLTGLSTPLPAQSSDTVAKPGFFHVSNHNVFAGAGYGSDLLYTVSSLSDHQPYLSSDIMYSWKGKFWTAFTIYNLPGVAITIPFYDFSAGYRHVFNDYFDVAASISSYQSSSKLEEQYYGSFEYLRVSGGFDWQLIYTKATLGSILGDNSGMYFYIKNSRYFSTPEMGRSKSYFSFDPNVNLLFGNSTEIIPLQRPNRPWQGGQNTDTQQTTTTRDVFGLLQVEISVPTAFYFHNLTLEAEPMYLFPSKKLDENESSSGFYFFLNLSYQIF